MEIVKDLTGDVKKYIDNHKNYKLQYYQKEFWHIVNWIKKVKKVEKGMELLEVGTGLGWFQVLAYKELGLKCTGIEISKKILEMASDFIKKNSGNSNLILGNIEDDILEHNKYDLIVADQVFEHVENYRAGLLNIFNALKPGGAFFFGSNNKWSFHVMSGEFGLPFYDILPNRVRYKIRQVSQGKDIMTLGIDFNTFSYKKLRKIFTELGFSKIYDKIDLREVSALKSPVRKYILGKSKNSPLVKSFTETFVPGTYFVCIK